MGEPFSTSLSARVDKSLADVDRLGGHGQEDGRRAVRMRARGLFRIWLVLLAVWVGFAL